MLAGNLAGAPRVQGIVAIETLQPLDGLLARGKRGKAGAGGQMRAPAGVLHERRTSRRQIALRAIAEPSRPARHVGVLGDPEFRLRAPDVIAVIPERTRDAHRVDRRPSVLAKQSLRPVHSQLEPLNGVSGKVDEPQELAILVAIDFREALSLPR